MALIRLCFRGNDSKADNLKQFMSSIKVAWHLGCNFGPEKRSLSDLQTVFLVESIPTVRVSGTKHCCMFLTGSPSPHLRSINRCTRNIREGNWLEFTFAKTSGTVSEGRKNILANSFPAQPQGISQGSLRKSTRSTFLVLAVATFKGQGTNVTAVTCLKDQIALKWDSRVGTLA